MAIFLRLTQLRKLRTKKLVIIGLIVFSISTFLELFFGLSLPHWPEKAIQELAAGWQPSSVQVEREVNAYLGSFGEQLQQRVKTTQMMQTTVFLSVYFWRISGLMLLGMALFKSKFLLGEKEKKYYQKVAVWTGISGALLVVWGIIKNFEANWQLEYSMFIGNQFNYWGSLLVAIAYLSLIILVVKNGKMVKLIARLSAVGRMALTNYLMQTLMGTFIFYGFGLGLFGQVPRTYQMLIVMGIWVIQLWYSPLWLRYFRYGPFEWIWRSLTWLKAQPLRR